MKTAREIAKKHEQGCEDGGANYHTDTSIVNAMQEYSDQQTSQLKEQLSIEKMNSENSKDSYNVIIHELKEQLAAKERESINFAAYLSVNNYESSNGINYNKFRMEYGSKYIITTKHIDDIYKDFINTPK